MFNPRYIGVLVALMLAVPTAAQAVPRPDPKPMDAASATGSSAGLLAGEDRDLNDPEEVSSTNGDPDDSIEYQYYDTKGKPVGTKQDRVLADSGTGGQVQNAGCIRIWVNNQKWNPTHDDHLWRYRIETYGCFNRALKQITYPNTDKWSIDFYGISSLCYSWVGQVGPKDVGYYDWAGGYAPKSGYKHHRKGHIQLSCGPTLGNWYPENWLRLHSNGTFSWTTKD